MRRVAAMGVVILAIVAIGPILAHAQQPEGCRPAGDAPPGYQPVTIGHFSEGADDLAEFCRYLVRQRIWPSFIDLGSVKEPTAAQRAHAAVEEGSVDVLWVNSYAVGAILEANRSIRLRVVAFTDFLVLHLGMRQRGVHMATDAAFAPAAVAVRTGRSMFFADVLFKILRRKPRCLETAVDCLVLPGEGLTAELDRFLSGGASRAVVLTSWALPPKGPDVVIRSLYAGEFHLVGVPPATVVAMQSVTGALAILQIPRGAYGPRQSAEVPTAAVTQMIVSGTPPEVLARVRELAVRLNNALFEVEPRIDTKADLPPILEMTRQLAASTGGRLTLHSELFTQLDARGLRRSPPEPREPEPKAPEPNCRLLISTCE